MDLSGDETTSQLQATIISVTSTGDTTTSIVVPHHPITCKTGSLYYEEDGTFKCDHAEVPPDDLRTEQGIRHSLALLLIELAMKL